MSTFGSVNRNIAAGADGLPQSRSESPRAAIKNLGRESGSLEDLQNRRAQPTGVRGVNGTMGGGTANQSAFGGSQITVGGGGLGGEV
jgi:hypothetical protein